MDKELTQAEESIVNQMESMGKWDTLIHDLSLFMPCSVIIVLSACYNSVPGIIAGLVTYGGFRLWISTRQCGQIPTLKSAIRKLKVKSQQTDQENIGSTDTSPKNSL